MKHTFEPRAHQPHRTLVDRRRGPPFLQCAGGYFIDDYGRGARPSARGAGGPRVSELRPTMLLRPGRIARCAGRARTTHMQPLCSVCQTGRYNPSDAMDRDDHDSEDDSRYARAGVSATSRAPRVRGVRRDDLERRGTARALPARMAPSPRAATTARASAAISARLDTRATARACRRSAPRAQALQLVRARARRASQARGRRRWRPTAQSAAPTLHGARPGRRAVGHARPARSRLAVP